MARSPSRPRRALRAVAGALVFLLAIAGAAAGTAWWKLRGSLAALDGALPLPGLRAPVTVERDALGVPTIRGATRLDVARATGFVHAQERFFQMDLLRRRAAGELAELVGARALPMDRRERPHRFRQVARAALAAARAEHRALAEAYAEGVNAGLAALREPPFEYLLLGARPAPWRAEDVLLCSLTMFVELQGDDDAHEAAMGLLHETLPAPVADFLAPVGTSWDAPLVGPALPGPGVPAPAVLDLRKAGHARAPASGLRLEAWAPGSNAFAVAGARSAHGGALLADDMHLGLMVPNVWFRASLAWEEGGVSRRVTGVTLPGTPAVVAGSNGQVAWGFTNSYGDFQDLVEVEPDPADSARYLAPGGPRPFEHPVEVLRVKGGAEERLVLTTTVWGPVLGRDRAGRPRALRWTAHDPAAVNLELAGLERAGDLAEALAVANRSGIAPQNFLCADARGRVGWTVAGVLPRRVGFDGQRPTSWADGARRWDGWRAPEETPRIVDPPDGLLWTANARVVDGEALRVIGDGGYWLGARAQQIRDDLRGRPRWSERELLEVQLDDRAVLLGRWQALLAEVLAGAPAGGRREEARRAVAAWEARAAVDSAGYRLVRGFRLAVLERALAPFAGALRRGDELFDGSELRQAEGPAWALVQARPAHLLDPAYASWDALLLDAADAALAGLGPGPVAAHPWGEHNTLRMEHPLARAVPALAPLLDMPREPLPGDQNMPRFQAPAAGASERMVVSPGREAQGLFHMPGGQSGHPLSPFYRAGHEAWARGEPTPFLPGPAEHTLALVPPTAPGER